MILRNGNKMEKTFASWKVYIAILLGLSIVSWMLYRSVQQTHFIESKNQGNVDEKAVMQPYGIEFIEPDSNSFFVHFMMVEDFPGDEDAEMYVGVAKFDVPFKADKSQYLIYNF